MRGFRCRWLARLTGGRLGLGRWTQEDVDRHQEWAEIQHAQFRDLVDPDPPDWP